MQAEGLYPRARAAPRVGSKGHRHWNGWKTGVKRVKNKGHSVKDTICEHNTWQRADLHFSKHKPSLKTRRGHMTHFISCFPALERRTTNITKQVGFLLAIFIFQKWNWTVFVDPLLPYLPWNTWSKQGVSLHLLTIPTLVMGSSYIFLYPLQCFYTICAHLEENTAFFLHRDKCGCIYNRAVYKDRICRE